MHPPHPWPSRRHRLPRPPPPPSPLASSSSTPPPPSVVPPPPSASPPADPVLLLPAGHPLVEPAAATFVRRLSGPPLQPPLPPPSRVTLASSDASPPPSATSPAPPPPCRRSTLPPSSPSASSSTRPCGLGWRPPPPPWRTRGLLCLAAAGATVTAAAALLAVALHASSFASAPASSGLPYRLSKQPRKAEGLRWEQEFAPPQLASPQSRKILKNIEDIKRSILERDAAVKNAEDGASNMKKRAEDLTKELDESEEEYQGVLAGKSSANAKKFLEDQLRDAKAAVGEAESGLKQLKTKISHSDKELKEKKAQLVSKCDEAVSAVEDQVAVTPRRNHWCGRWWSSCWRIQFRSNLRGLVCVIITNFFTAFESPSMMNRQWMYVDRRSREFIDGVNVFLDIVFRDLPSGSFIRCPCVDCRNEKEHLMRGRIQDHLLMRDFMPNYICWTYHGEVEHTRTEDEEEADEEKVTYDGMSDATTYEDVEDTQGDQFGMDDDLNQMLRDAEGDITEDKQYRKY